MINEKKVEKDMENLIAFSDRLIYKTASIKRYNTTQIIQTQSVLEHLGSVSLIAMVLADYFIRKGINLNVERIMRMAITHDLDEALYGDIPYDAKYEYGDVSKEFRASLDKMKTFTLKIILNQLDDKDVAKKYYDLMLEEKNKNTPEAKVVKLADFIDVLIFINHEISLGNKSVTAIRKRAEQNIRSMVSDIVKTAQ